MAEIFVQSPEDQALVEAHILTNEVVRTSDQIKLVAEECSRISQKLAGEGVAPEEREDLGNKLKALVADGVELDRRRKAAQATLVSKHMMSFDNQEN